MASLLRTWRVPLAVIIAAAIVVGAYVTTVATTRPTTARASTEAALLAQLASKDSDNDGLPDWEESLYGTDSHLIDSKGLGMTDGEAVAKGLIVPPAVADIPLSTEGQSAEELGLTSPATASLTDLFAKNFFALYLSAKQGGHELTDEEKVALAAETVARLSASIGAVGQFKKASDIVVAGSGAEALRTYAAAAETVFTVHSTSFTKSELEFFRDALEKGDQAALRNISLIATAYHNIAAGLSALSVPAELKDHHLALINGTASLGGIAADMAHYESDPLATMLALSHYKDAVMQVGNVFFALPELYKNAGVSFTSGEKGQRFVETLVGAKRP